MFSKAKTIALIFLFIASLYVVVLVSSSINSKRGVEGFGEEKPEKQQEEEKHGDKGASKDDVDAAYESRKYVMTMFDSMFKRQPTSDEVEQYASFGTQKAILNAILSDYDKLDGTGVASKEPVVDPFDQQQPNAAAPAPITPVPTTTTPATPVTYPYVVPAPAPTAAIEDKLTAVERAVKELRAAISAASR